MSNSVPTVMDCTDKKLVFTSRYLTQNRDE